MKNKQKNNLSGLTRDSLGAKVERTSRPRQSCRATTISDYESFLAVLKKNGKRLTVEGPWEPV